MDVLKYFGISIEGGLEYSGISTDLWNFCEGYGVLLTFLPICDFFKQETKRMVTTLSYLKWL